MSSEGRRFYGLPKSPDSSFLSFESPDEEEAPDITRAITQVERRPSFTGNYSIVHKGRYNGQEVAIKILKLVMGKSKLAMKRKMRRERRVWASLRHPNIVPLYGYAYDNDRIYGPWGAFISPWYPYGDAAKYLAAYGNDLSISTLADLWRGVIEGVYYLHSNNPLIVHGDLKPSNILVDEQGVPKICDFGLSRIFLEERASGLTTTSEHSGTDRYLAYELVVSEPPSPPTTASDVHALGCIGFEFLFLERPYAWRKHNRYRHVITDIRDGRPPAYRPTSRVRYINDIWDIFESCWSPNPRMRPTVQDLLSQYTEWQANLKLIITQRRNIREDFKMQRQAISGRTTPVSDQDDLLNRQNALHLYEGTSTRQTPDLIPPRPTQPLRSILKAPSNQPPIQAYTSNYRSRSPYLNSSRSSSPIIIPVSLSDDRQSMRSTTPPYRSRRSRSRSVSDESITRPHRSRRSRSRSVSDGSISDMERSQVRSSSASSCTRCGFPVDDPHIRRPTSRTDRYYIQGPSISTHERTRAPPFIYTPSSSFVQPYPAHEFPPSSLLAQNPPYDAYGLGYNPEAYGYTMNTYQSVPPEATFPYNQSHLLRSRRPNYSLPYNEPRPQPRRPAYPASVGMHPGWSAHERLPLPMDYF